MSNSVGEIYAAFDEIWEFWKNKEPGERSARQAFLVAARKYEKDYSLEVLKKAARLYYLKNQRQEFTQQLNNFFMKEEFVDALDADPDSDKRLKELEDRQKEAKLIATRWNLRRRLWWAEITEIDSKLPMISKALEDPFFRDNWKKALDKVVGIFKHKPREREKHAQLVISISWFCDLHKQTVVKILDGEYGQPQKDYRPQYSRSENLSEDELKKRQETSTALLNEVFGKDWHPGRSQSDGPPASADSSASEFPDLESDVD